MGKLFGYPEFDINGEEILCTYDNEYSEMMMDVRVYRMKAGEKRDFCRKGEEIAVLLLSGKINFACEDISETVSRESVFTEGPFAVHSCSDCLHIVFFCSFGIKSIGSRRKLQNISILFNSCNYVFKYS